MRRKLPCLIGKHEVTIKSARPKTKYEDLERAVEIHNYYIANSTATFHTEPEPAGYIRSIHARTVEHDLPFLVAFKHSPIHPGGQKRIWINYLNVIGFAYALPHSREGRPGWSSTVDLSLYLAHDVAGRGIGGELLDALLDHLAEKKNEDGSQRIREVLAVVALNPFEDQKDSAAFYRKQAFAEVGTMKGVGRKFERWIDVTVFQKSILDRFQGAELDESGDETEDAGDDDELQYYSGDDTDDSEFQKAMQAPDDKYSLKAYVDSKGKGPMSGPEESSTLDRLREASLSICMHS